MCRRKIHHSGEAPVFIANRSTSNCARAHHSLPLWNDPQRVPTD